ncbi:MAG TPA: TetR/AcrR family transcriptional regulator [Ohtaekwangia sp.]|uniref:TetR/AcrR family transcriptional regulator n=1 Tax=Ohtaekwangia sp. TaxID=2066019 RepID=UPI002F956580
MTKDEAIRAEVLKAARTLFQRYGFLKTTMEDIAKAAGKGKSTLYYYYASKDEIFDAVMKEDMEEVLGLTDTAIEKAPTAEEKLKTFTVNRIKLLMQKAALYSVIFGEISNNPNLIKKIKKTFEAREQQVLKNILQLGIANKEFKPIDERDLDDLAYVMLYAFRGIEMGLIEDNRIKKIGDRLEIILGLLANGFKK